MPSDDLFQSEIFTKFEKFISIHIRKSIHAVLRTKDIEVISKYFFKSIQCIPYEKEIAERRNIWCNKEWFINKWMCLCVCVSLTVVKRTIFRERSRIPLTREKKFDINSQAKFRLNSTENNELWHANIMLFILILRFLFFFCFKLILFSIFFPVFTVFSCVIISSSNLLFHCYLRWIRWSNEEQEKKRENESHLNGKINSEHKNFGIFNALDLRK